MLLVQGTTVRKMIQSANRSVTGRLIVAEPFGVVNLLCSVGHCPNIRPRYLGYYLRPAIIQESGAHVQIKQKSYPHT
jgi:hypothetical protein